MKNRIYICIDLKSFYAFVECGKRGLDPMTALLVVADAERSKNTICLAVSVGCKKKGIKNHCRLGDIPPYMDVIVAPPRILLSKRKFIKALISVEILPSAAERNVKNVCKSLLNTFLRLVLISDGFPPFSSTESSRLYSSCNLLLVSE